MLCKPVEACMGKLVNLVVNISLLDPLERPVPLFYLFVFRSEQFKISLFGG